MYKTKQRSVKIRLDKCKVDNNWIHWKKRVCHWCRNQIRRLEENWDEVNARSYNALTMCKVIKISKD